VVFLTGFVCLLQNKYAGVGSAIEYAVCALKVNSLTHSQCRHFD
jgi:hypothetical protein